MFLVSCHFLCHFTECRRLVPWFAVSRHFEVKKYAALVCQLAPLLLFYIVVMCLGMSPGGRLNLQTQQSATIGGLFGVDVFRALQRSNPLTQATQTLNVHGVTVHHLHLHGIRIVRLAIRACGLQASSERLPNARLASRVHSEFPCYVVHGKLPGIWSPWRSMAGHIPATEAKALGLKHQNRRRSLVKIEGRVIRVVQNLGAKLTRKRGLRMVLKGMWRVTLSHFGKKRL